MTENNIYQAPQSSVVEEQSGEVQLASRWARLGAALVDTLVLGLVIVPVGLGMGVFEAVIASAQVGAAEVETRLTLIMALSSIGGFFLINGYWLHTHGQTVGKKLLGIKIVDMEAQHMPFGRLIGLRYVPVWLVPYVPFVGSALSIIDTLFIFRADKRCIHDLIAGTQVINC